MLCEIKFGAMTLEEMALASGGRLLSPGTRQPRFICTDSREVVRDTLFVAIRGERVDGNDYVTRAFDSGAVCALCERLPEGHTDGAIILVDDTEEALARIGCEIMRRTSPISVAITGSVGKTTAKQMTASVFQRKYSTLYTEGNFNSTVGLPMTLFGLTPSTEAAVLELGMSGRGEIERLSRIVMPDIGIITCIGSSHIEQLGSREGIRDAKMEIRLGMKEGSKLILDGDEPLLAGVEGAVYVSRREGGGDYSLSGLRRVGDGMLFDLITPKGRVCDISLPAIGEHLAYDAALAYAAGDIAGISEEEIRAGLCGYRTTGLRQRITTGAGRTLIEDCYNANPESMRASLSVLRSFEGRRIAVLGDMRELGASSPEYHRMIGECAATSCEELFTFGRLADDIADGALLCGMKPEAVHTFPELDRPDLLAEALGEISERGDTILFKASRAVELERVCEMLKAKLK